MGVSALVGLQRSMCEESAPNAVMLYCVNSSGATRTVVGVTPSTPMPLTRASSLQSLVGQTVPATDLATGVYPTTPTLSFNEVYASAGMRVSENDTSNSQEISFGVQFDDGSVCSFPGGSPTLTVVPPFVRQAVNGSPFGANLALPGPGQLCFDQNENSYANGFGVMGPC